MSLQNLGLELLEEDEAAFDESGHSLDEQAIPQQPRQIERHRRGKQAHKPLDAEYRRIQPHLDELLANAGQVLTDALSQNALVADDADHIGVVVHRDDALNHLRQQPEALLFSELHRQDKVGDEVKSLAVADERVSPGKAQQHPAHRFYALFLGVLFLQNGPMQVQVDRLAEVVRVVFVIQQLLIDSLVGVHVEPSPRSQHPQLLPSFVTTDRLLTDFELQYFAEHRARTPVVSKLLA